MDHEKNFSYSNDSFQTQKVYAPYYNIPHNSEMSNQKMEKEEKNIEVKFYLALFLL